MYENTNPKIKATVLLTTYCLLTMVAFFSFLFSANAQFREMPFQRNYPTKYSSVSTIADLSFNANTITNSFFNTFYLTKRFLDESLKDNQSSKLTNNNRIGADIDGGMYYEHRNDTSKKILSDFFVAVRDREHVDARFHRDLFDLFFYGNKMFAGKTADLSDFSLNVLKYQQLQYGWVKRDDVPQSTISFGEGSEVKQSKHYTLGAAISLLKGQQHLSISTNKATLFTEQNGEYIDLSVQAQYAQTDTTHKNLDAWNGIGTSVDLFFSYSKDSSQTICFEASDLGAIWWNKNTTTASIDTSFHFEGVEVSNIFSFNNSVITHSPDSIQAYITNKKNAVYRTVLPSLFHLFFEKKIISQKLSIQTGLQYRLAANYAPYIYLTTHYYFTSRFMASVHLAQGGYGNLHLGLAVAKDFGKGYMVSIGSDYFNGLTGLSPTGQEVYLAFKKLFF